MGCQELRQLLNTDWRGNDSLSSCIATHVRSCADCHHGLVLLVEALIANDPLSCDQCRARFPAYYEVTRPEFPLIEMEDTELAEMAFHLSHCASCHEEYEELVLLSELEERNELMD